jgi:hypothetical protein
MRTLSSCLLAGVLLCASGRPACAAAAAAAGTFPAVLTASGEVSCGEFIEDQRANNPALNSALMNLFVVWVWSFLVDYDHRGFSDARVEQADRPVDLPDRSTVLSFLQHFCEHNPSSTVYKGAMALLESRHRSGLESKQAVIVGRLRVRKTRTARGSRAARECSK